MRCALRRGERDAAAQRASSGFDTRQALIARPANRALTHAATTAGMPDHKAEGFSFLFGVGGVVLPRLPKAIGRRQVTRASGPRQNARTTARHSRGAKAAPPRLRDFLQCGKLVPAPRTLVGENMEAQGDNGAILHGIAPETCVVINLIHVYT